MKIQFLIRSLGYGGAERQLVGLMKGLKNNGHAVSISVYYPGGPLEKDLRETGITVKTLDKHGRWDTFPFLYRLGKIVKSEKPQIIHGYMPVSNLVATLLNPLFPQIRVVWGVRASNMNLDQYGLLSRVVFKVECLFSKYADLIIVNSHAGKEYHKKNGFPEDKMIVIPNGIDTERFTPDTAARERLRDQWGIKSNEKLIGLVGRLDPMKDHPTFLQAAGLVIKEQKDVRFVCVGGGTDEYLSELRALAHNLGLERMLIWEGSREDMNAVHNALDVATSSSKYGEGFSNVIGEAMACGVPCVVTDVGDSKWIVADTGIAVPPGDPEALAKAWSVMLAKIHTGESLHRDKARRRIVEQFSVDILVRRTETALRSLVGD